MLVSARLARPSLEVHLRFTIVPKQFLGDQAQIDFLQTWKMTKSEFHFQLPHLKTIIKNNIILKLKPKRNKKQSCSSWTFGTLNGNHQERHDGMPLQEYGLSRRVTVPCWYNVFSVKSS